MGCLVALAIRITTRISEYINSEGTKPKLPLIDQSPANNEPQITECREQFATRQAER
ncbi:MAG: hypothetical protein MUF49_04725 [Oculatellaceae cyanobacterium Prado106]|nr:hypothetical protein [Oculatellaceae cyanobacterium Prado106]